MLTLHPRVRAYLDAVIEKCDDGDGSLVSVILFGSAATGGFADAISDVDLIFVLADGAGQEVRRRFNTSVRDLEISHGLAGDSLRSRGVFESMVDKITGNALSLLVCTRAELVSANAAAIFGVPAAQALFVDRVVIPSIVFSAVTVWGEDLLGEIVLPPIRRLDVFKSFFSLANQVWVSVSLFAVLPRATRLAMGALKKAVHHYYFCCHGRPASLEIETEFFQRNNGASPALEQLLLLRRDYKESFGFAVRCMPAVARLHMHAALDNRFPRAIGNRGDRPAIPTVRKP
jgi:predicted nucleotidyltransferase